MTDRARSVVMDLFGEYLRYTDNAVRVGSLIELLGVFGVEPAATRMTLSRMRRDGWFETHRVGRETVYTLSDHMVDVLADGRERIFHRAIDQWDGTWTQVVYQVPETARLAREGLRKQLIWLGFGQLAASIWMSPHAPDDRVDRLRAAFPEASIDVLATRAVSMSDRDLARRCWDLEELNHAYRDLLERIERTEEPEDGAAALAVRTRLVAEARRLTFLDPLLPSALQPEDWVGDRAFAAFIELHDRLAPAAEAYVEGVLGQRLARATA